MRELGGRAETAVARIELLLEFGVGAIEHVRADLSVAGLWLDARKDVAQGHTLLGQAIALLPVEPCHALQYIREAR